MQAASAVRWVMLTGLLLVTPGCRPPAPPVEAEPRHVRVDWTRYRDAHPAAAQLRALDRDIAALAREPAPRVQPARVRAPEVSELPVPAEPDSGAPVRTVDLRRAEELLRRDYAMRREAIPPSAAPQPPPLPAVEIVEAKTAPPAEPEVSIGLDIQINRLTRQVERLEEKPPDRLIYTPAQLRRRRELLEVTRVEIARLRQENVARLRRALAPRDPAPVQRPPREVVAPAGPPRPDAEALRRLDRREAEALAALRAAPDLPAPSAASEVVPPGDHHESSRKRFGQAAEKANSVRPVQTRVDRGRYEAALRRRRAALQAGIARDLQAAAAVAARERGWVLTRAAGAPDVTAKLTDGVIKELQGSGGSKNQVGE